MAIYKDTKNNSWYFRVYLEDKNGIKKQKARFGFKSKSLAKIAENEFILKSNIEREIEDNNILFIDLYDEYIKYKEQSLKFQSFRAIKNRFENHILPFFKDYKINNIKSKDYINWKSYILSKKYSYKYNCNLHLCMVNILNYAINFYDLKENVASKIGNFSKREYFPKVNFWTYEEFNTFINKVDDNIYYSLFTLLYYSGMRLGECLALNWNDIKENYIDVNKTLIRGNSDNYSFNTPKTKDSIRKIKIDNNTMSIINDLKEFYKNTINFSNDWFVFGGIKPLATTTIERKKNNYCKLSNVKKIRIHDFRHSHATLLISKGLPITVISKRLGHSNTATTLNIYSHFISEDEDKAIDIINNLKK